jgi:NAD(P)H-flavin reductase
MVVRGMGQAPAVKMAEHLLRANNELLVYLDPGSTENAFIQDELERMGAFVKRVDLLDDSTYQEMEQILREQSIGLVVSAGADIQHVRLSDLIKSTGSAAMIVVLNNHSMTCGEGICGACMIEVAKGEKVKTCKSQLLGEQIVKTINTHLYNE